MPVDLFEMLQETSMNKHVNLKEPIVCTVVGSATQITVPKGAQLVLASMGDASGTARVKSPAALEDVLVRLPEHFQAKADGVAGKEPAQELSSEQLVKREQYKASIQAVLAKILDWEKLPAVDAQSFAHGIRDMGLVTDFVSGVIALSQKRLRAWIHHINMQIPSPSLTVELAAFPDKSKHLVLVLSSAW